jgi:hypothetical protein
VSDAGAEEPVPKLPRGRGLKFSGPELFRIVMTLMTLVAVIVLAKPCGNSVSNFVMGYGSGSAATTPKPGNVEPPPVDMNQYEQLRPGMSDEEIKAAIERSKAKNAAAAGSAMTTGSAAVSPGAVRAGSATNTGSAQH